MQHRIAPAGMHTAACMQVKAGMFQRTMFMASGWKDRMSAVRQASGTPLSGLAPKACMMSGNCAASRMKNPCTGSDATMQG